MRTIVLFAVAAAALCSAAPASARGCCRSSNYSPEPTGNYWIRYQQATDPGYNGYTGRRYYSDYGYGGGYYGYYAGPPLIACIFIRCRPNAVKDNTATVQGRPYKACPTDPAVPIDRDCPGSSPPSYAAAGGNQQVPDGAIVESYNDDNSNFVTVRIINGQRVATIERAR